MRGLIALALALALSVAALARSGGSGEPAGNGGGEQPAATSSGGQKHVGPADDDGPDTSPPAAPVETEPPADPYEDFPTFAPEDDYVLSYTSWRVLSARIYYDEGGGGDLSNVITTTVDIYDDGTWTFGSSSGTWYVDSISDSDWAGWGIEPYGPTEKLVLEGWNGDLATGPIEESGGYIDFMWVIYREGPPTIGAPGTVWMKLGVDY